MTQIFDAIKAENLTRIVKTTFLNIITLLVIILTKKSCKIGVIEVIGNKTFPKNIPTADAISYYNMPQGKESIFSLGRREIENVIKNCKVAVIHL